MSRQETLMDEIDKGQTADMRASIAEANRAAGAMEGIALSMAQSIPINKGIADVQRLVTELSGRAYLTVVFEGVISQNEAARIRFEPRIFLVNKGNTPAYKVQFRTSADVLPFPFPDPFDFPLPPPAQDASISIIGPGLLKTVSAVVPHFYSAVEAAQVAVGIDRRIAMWGVATYEDAFGKERYVKWSFTHIQLGPTNWISYDTRKHNDAN